MYSVGPNSETFMASRGYGFKIYGHVDSVLCIGGQFRVNKFNKPSEQISPNKYIDFIDKYFEFLPFVRIQNRNNFKFFFEPGIGLFVHNWEERVNDQIKKGNFFCTGFSFEAGVNFFQLEIGTGYKIVFTGNTHIQYILLNFGVYFATFKTKQR